MEVNNFCQQNTLLNHLDEILNEELSATELIPWVRAQKAGCGHQRWFLLVVFVILFLTTFAEQLFCMSPDNQAASLTAYW